MRQCAEISLEQSPRGSPVQLVSFARVLARFACLARGGHRWTRVMDSSGSFTYCERCGELHHVRPVAADIHHQAHGNLGYKVTLRDEPGADVVDEQRP